MSLNQKGENDTKVLAINLTFVFSKLTKGINLWIILFSVSHKAAPTNLIYTSSLLLC